MPSTSPPALPTPPCPPCSTVAVDGPLQGVPIAGCLGDQQAAMMGQRCAVHEAKNTYGTGAPPYLPLSGSSAA